MSHHQNATQWAIREATRKQLELAATRLLREAERAGQPYRRSRRRKNRVPKNGVLAAAARAECEPRQVVYVICSGGHGVKVGIAEDVEKRCRELQTGSPHRLRVVGCECPTGDARQIERRCHARLAAHRLSGEWFGVDAEAALLVVREEIAAALA
jgi:hypothetical protein